MIFASAVIERGELGLDTVRIGGEASRRTLNKRQAAGWRVNAATNEDGRASPRTYLRTLECDARLQYIRGRGEDADRAFVEFSVPKLLDGHNVKPASLAQARLAVSGVLQEASDYVIFHETNVNRLDIARDFTGVEHVGAILLALAAAPIAGRKIRVQYSDPTVGGNQTVVVRNSDGACRAYDKAEESKVPEAAGRLRVEAQERRRTLRAAGVEAWDRLTEQHIYDLGRARFEWAGFHSPINSTSDAIARVLAADLNGAGKAKLIGYYELLRRGLDGQLSTADRSRFRRSLFDLRAIGSDHIEHATQLHYDRGLLQEAKVA